MIEIAEIAIAARDGGRFGAVLALPESGQGPGLVLLHEEGRVTDRMKSAARLFAAEGYVVLAPDIAGGASADRAIETIAALGVTAAAFDALRARSECVGGVAIIGFGQGGALALRAASELDLDAVIAWYPAALPDLPAAASALRCPAVIQLATEDPLWPPEAIAALRQRLALHRQVKLFVYPGAGPGFFDRLGPTYQAIATDLSLTRALELLRPRIGPVYDLEALWEQHTLNEFVIRDADRTIETMVTEEDPYVNHVPSMTGGVGHAQLRHFYRHYFCHVHPDDFQPYLVSRTVGANRIVDEFVVSFTHDRLIDYLLPGIAPSGRKLTLAAVGIISFRGPKIRHEHLYYDQATLLAQLGLLDATPCRVPGAEAAGKVLDPHAFPSNGIMPTWRPEN